MLELIRNKNKQINIIKLPKQCQRFLKNLLYNFEKLI